MIDVDTARKSVFLENGDEVSYDMLVLATGARHAYFGNDQWEKLAPGLKALEDATTIRRACCWPLNALSASPTWPGGRRC